MSKTVFYNAKVYVEKGVYADALYQEDGIIRLVGGDKQVLTAAGPDAEAIDCEGRTIIPGFNDSHMHLVNLGKQMMVPNLAKCKDLEDIIQTCRKYLEEHPNCKGLQCQGWREDEWPEGHRRLPDKHDLDRISTEIPVAIVRGCEHAGAVNSVLLANMGLDKDHHTIEGGEVVLGEDGEPNGYLKEAAIRAIYGYIPNLSDEELEEAILTAMRYCASWGITTVQSMDLGTYLPNWTPNYRVLKGIYEKGEDLVRYTGQTSFATVEDFKAYVDGSYGKTADGFPFKEVIADDRMHMGPLKLVRDGALGARTAMMRREYCDDPGNYGIDSMSDESYQAYVDVAAAAGLQTVTHCIGDEAIERCTKQWNKTGRKDLRFGVVHNQITDVPLLQFLKDSGCVVAYQPIFLDSDMHAVESRCGKELSSTSYAFKTAREMGLRCSYGTDAPVVDPNPFDNLYSAVTRKDLKGWPEGGWNPQECVDRETAVDCYTEDSAYFEFRETVKGRLKPGFYADLTVLDKDFFTCAEDEIRGIRPVLTMCAGKITYREK